MKNDILDNMIKAGILKHYELITLDGDFNQVTTPGFGQYETQQLKLIFSRGEVLVIKSMCTGPEENSVFYFADHA